ncbi:Arachidonate 5-lipoxygenase-activating protein, partial [Ophiophagus hannah]
MRILPFLLSYAPAAFAGLMYLFVRQKYFVGYMGERTQSTPGYIFGKRIIFFLFLMSVAGVFNYYLGVLFGSDFQMHIKTVTNTISPLLLIP